MKRPSPTMTIGYAGILSMMALTSATAAPAEKVTLCHWDAEAGVYEELAVPGKAADNHMRQHELDAVVGQGIGEGCVVAVAVPALASATATDASGATVQVARLLDSDGSGTVSVGDTVEVGQIPTAFDVSTLASATAGPVTVEAVLLNGPTSVQVRAAGATYLWSTNDGGAGTEVYMEVGRGGTTALVDARNASYLYDVLQVQATSPSAPSAGALAFGRSTADDRFVNVVLTNS